MAKALTKKRKGFVKDYIETGIASLAVKRNFDVKDDDSARSLGSQLLTDDKIRKSLADMIPDELVNEKHLALLNKKEVKRTFNQEIGEWIEVETGQVDTEAVKAGVKMAYDLKGSFAPIKSLVGHFSINDEHKSKANQALDGFSQGNP